MKQLLTLLDKNNDSVIDYNEFLRGIAGHMNKNREGIVRKAFHKLDADNNGVITLHDVKMFYDASGHPEVKAGRKTVEEILEQFLDTFEIHYSNLHGVQNRNKNVTLDEFIEYYNNISCSIDNDEYFQMMVKNAWKLDQPSAFKKPYRADI